MSDVSTDAVWLVELLLFGSGQSCKFVDRLPYNQTSVSMVLSEESSKGGEICAILQQMVVDGTWSGMSVAEDEGPAVGASIILERKPDAGNPHVRFDERGYG